MAPEFPKLSELSDYKIYKFYKIYLSWRREYMIFFCIFAVMKFTAFITAAIISSATLTAAAAPRETPADILHSARMAFKDYDFDRASDLYARYDRLRPRASADEAAADRRALRLASEFMERVEKIEVIDSLAVPRDEFFRAYRLSPSAGRITAAAAPAVGTVHTSESGDHRFAAAPDSTGRLRLTEQIRLTDGSWSESAIIDSLMPDSDAAYPFMMADGTTLYFAAQGAESIGGYDIFVASRDPDDASWLAPQNLGMPYNSPADDYLLAIDETVGIGWWATDRNQLPDGMITIYVFAPADIRVNVDSDADDLVQRAKLNPWRTTQTPGRTYPQLPEPQAEAAPAPEFILPLGHGTVYTRYSDFRSADARSLMRTLAARRAESEKRLTRLYALRHAWSKGRHNASDAALIRRLEAETEADRREMARLRHEIARIEVPMIRKSEQR